MYFERVTACNQVLLVQEYVHKHGEAHKTHDKNTHIQTVTADLLALDVDKDQVEFDLTVHKWVFERIWKFVYFFSTHKKQKHK